MVIQHCIEAMNANGTLKTTTKDIQKSSEKLSTGYKINVSADDAAGLAISEKMRKQIRGLSQATSNAEDGISMVQVADGAMAEIQDMMDRGVELSVKAANGTLSDDDRKYIQMEIDHIKDEVDAIKERTKFNEIYVLKGDTYTYYEESPGKIVKEGSLPSWVGTGSSITDGILSETYTEVKTYITTASVSAGQSNTNTINVPHPAASLDFSRLTTAADLQSLIGDGFHATCCTCDKYYSIEFTNSTSNEVYTLSSNAYVFRIGIADIDLTITNPSPGEQLIDKILDGTTYNGTPGNPKGHYTMMAKDSTNPNLLWIYDDRTTDNSVVKPSDLSSWVDWTYHSYAMPNLTSNRGLFGDGYMKEYDAYTVDEEYGTRQRIDLQVGTDANNILSCILPSISAVSLGLIEADVTKQPNGATEAIDIFGNAKKLVSSERIRMGSYQNRLEHTINNLGNVVENTTFSESNVRDLDMASELVRYSNLNILSQSGTSMLAQANQTNQGVFNLLGQ